MLKRSQLFASVALTLALSAPVAAETNLDTIVATVNGTDITMGHMIVVRSTLPDQYRDLSDEVLYKGILDQIIQQHILAQAASSSVPKRVQLALENERRSLMAAEHMDKILGEFDTENRIKAAYEAKYADATPEKEFNASHILVESEDETKALVKELEDGADFAELAKAKSTGPSSTRGGALGWFGKGQMVPEFENAIAGMEDGAISAPIKTQFGWHVIKLNASRAKDTPKLEEVHDELANRVRLEIVDSYIKELIGSASISRTSTDDVDASQIKNFSLLEK